MIQTALAVHQGWGKPSPCIVGAPLAGALEAQPWLQRVHKDVIAGCDLAGPLQTGLLQAASIRADSGYVNCRVRRIILR